MQNKVRRQHILLILSGIILLAVVYAGFLAERFVESTVTRIRTTKERTASYELNKKILSEETARVAKLNARIEKLETYHQDTATTPDLLSAFESIGASTGATLAITAVDAPTKENPFITIRFAAKGSTTAIDTLLDRIAHQTYVVTFSDFALFRNQSFVPADATLPTKKTAPAATSFWELRATVQIPI